MYTLSRDVMCHQVCISAFLRLQISPTTVSVTTDIIVIFVHCVVSLITQDSGLDYILFSILSGYILFSVDNIYSAITGPSFSGYGRDIFV